MKAAAVCKINSKFQDIPTAISSEIMSYELKLIQRGIDDIKSGRIISHAEALKKISSHIKSRHK